MEAVQEAAAQGQEVTAVEVLEAQILEAVAVLAVLKAAQDQVNTQAAQEARA